MVFFMASTHAASSYTLFCYLLIVHWEFFHAVRRCHHSLASHLPPLARLHSFLGFQPSTPLYVAAACTFLLHACLLLPSLVVLHSNLALLVLSFWVLAPLLHVFMVSPELLHVFVGVPHIFDAMFVIFYFVLDLRKLLKINSLIPNLSFVISGSAGNCECDSLSLTCPCGGFVRLGNFGKVRALPCGSGLTLFPRSFTLIGLLVPRSMC